MSPSLENHKKPESDTECLFWLVYFRFHLIFPDLDPKPVLSFPPYLILYNTTSLTTTALQNIKTPQRFY